MNNQYSLVIDSPLGRLGVQTANEKIQRLDYLAGSWSVEEAKEFERNLADSRVIDAELWT